MLMGADGGIIKLKEPGEEQVGLQQVSAVTVDEATGEVQSASEEYQPSADTTEPGATNTAVAAVWPSLHGKTGQLV